MKTAARTAVFLFLAASAAAQTAFRRGDSNADGTVDLSDGVSTLGFLFLGRSPPACRDAADANDSGDLDLSDAVFTFGFLFTGGASISPPGSEQCGPDPTDDSLHCESYAPPSEARRCDNGPPAFSILVGPHQIATYGITFEASAADFDLTAYDPQGQCLGGRVRHECSWSDRSFETGEEFLSVVNASHNGDTPYTWRVAARSGLAMELTPSITVLSFLDGRACTDFYPLDECEGRPGGALRLLQFPFVDTEDQWAEDGYRFDSIANYRWARRELVMLVRYAIGSTRAKFPGTKPLGLGDMSQRDGITPGYDVGQPRHPETTHDQGANIDIAYYSTLAEGGELDYSPIRAVCDASGGTNDGAYCTAGASQSHVVDLPRQVYFMAKLFESPRLRVIGVDRVIAPLLIAEAERQAALGWITEAMLGGFRTKMAYGDGWPFQHTHIHVSLVWWQ